MKWSNKFIYPKSTRSIEDGYRKYFLGEEKLPSVTTILSATKSEEEKAAAFSSSDLVALKIVVTLGSFSSPKKYFLYPSSIDLVDFG